MTDQSFLLQGDALDKSIKSWEESLLRLSERTLGNKEGHRLHKKYQSLLTDFYQKLVSPRYALKDLLQLEQIATADVQRVSLLKPCQGFEHYRLHFYSRKERFLDEYIPVLENMNLRVMDQVQFSVEAGDETLFIKSFSIKAENIQENAFVRLKKRMLEAIQAIMDERVENDPLNKLIVLTGMSWQEVDALRAYRNYYLQLELRTSPTSIHHALIHNPEVTLCLFRYFEARFRPNPEWNDQVVREEQALFPLRLQLLGSMASVADINDDRILRTLFNLIDATMRCNFHMRLNQEDYFISFKINSLGVIDMPVPKPQYEIYVHAVDMEGIHLRAGKVSRGGIRWSDRSDDFRTEILDLMQTQISKNALIIPTGAKGGFIVKKKGSKLAWAAAGKNAYIRLIKGMLDLTDNYSGEQIVRSSQIVAYDNSDPYLVVAADKGTAQFSDIANSISADYRYWLGDAFASGGSRGYNHKALGITARGAWECVKRHFREAGKDIQNEAFTVVGIGSMDGDVFGNSMLLSPYIRLLAAFSGQHIFIDPDPADNDGPLNERKRLFELQGSTWNDYDRTLISSGGGVYLRSSMDIPVSPELRKWLGIRYKSLDGESLIRYLLTAPVELLWLGGIGTYVKASTEKHEEVGDRANDNVRVDACDLKARIVGEGANLGFTQKGRIEYGLLGGRINTDAVDNSAGVDTSDHEVNLKILLAGLQKKNIISDYQQFFISMTGAVCRLVLANNYAQSLCLSLEQIRSAGDPMEYLRLAERLEASGFFDRAVESFPHAKELLARPGKNLTRPELAVLMAAGKMYLTQQIQTSTALFETECSDCYLQSYFPEQIIEHYKEHLSSHPLADEIKATIVSNKIINQAGCSFLNLDIDNDNSNRLDHVACYLTFDRVLDGDAIRHKIFSLDNKVAADLQNQLLLLLETTLTGFCRWALLHNKVIRPDERTINCYRRYLREYVNYLRRYDGIKNERFKTQLAHFLQGGIPAKLAETMMLIASLEDFPFILSLASETDQNAVTLFRLFNDINAYLGLDLIYERLRSLPAHDYWERKVAVTLQEDIKSMAGLLIRDFLSNKAASSADYFNLPEARPKISRYRRIYQEIISAAPVNLFPYLVLSKELEKLSVRVGSSGAND